MEFECDACGKTISSPVDETGCICDCECGEFYPVENVEDFQEAES